MNERKNERKRCNKGEREGGKGGLVQSPNDPSFYVGGSKLRTVQTVEWRFQQKWKKEIYSEKKT